LGSPPNGRVTVDFRETPAISAAAAKKLFLGYLAERGMLIDDFQQWQGEVQGTTVSLAGKMSTPGIRKLLSVIECPAPAAANPDAPTKSASGSDSSAQAANTQAYFKNVTSMFDDLKEDMQEATSLASTTLYFDKYARRIERLPMLDVDPQMLEYGAYVAAQLRQSSGAVRTMGIRKGARTREITSGGGDEDYYYYGGYGYGRYNSGVTGMVNDLKDVEQQRGIVRAQEKANMATSVHQIRADVIAATSDIRRQMTEKYRVQF
jgi:hypothetical protein